VTGCTQTCERARLVFKQGDTDGVRNLQRALEFADSDTQSERPLWP
jgi:hypothetical protein